MVHAIQPIKCPEGHTLPISFDNNECGCHHDGKPCLIVICKECLRNSIEEIDRETKDKLFRLVIPIDKKTLKEIKGLM